MVTEFATGQRYQHRNCSDMVIQVEWSHFSADRDAALLTVTYRHVRGYAMHRAAQDVMVKTIDFANWAPFPKEPQRDVL